jgi:hypothetical protein
MQCAFYLRGLEAALGEEIATYYVVAAEVDAPRHHDIRMFSRDTLLEVWRERCMPAMSRYENWQKGIIDWPGKDPDITEETPPNWAM